MEEFLDGMSLEDVYAIENLERLEGFSELDHRERSRYIDVEAEEEELEDRAEDKEEDEDWY